VSRPAEAAAVAAIEDREGWVPGILEAVRTERARLRTELEARGLGPLPSGANFLLLPLEGIGNAASVTAALRDQGVAVRPFPAVWEDGGTVVDAVRITIGPRAEMDRFLAALDQVLGS
jgi:histidinol-phosphate/aromatic aminotransferase/cobyric acid decarboxylase-like protein